jgi:heme-degrading monooxygenase HmoA
MADIKHAVQLKLEVNPERMDGFLERIRNGVFPGLNNRNGMRRAYLLRSPEDDIVLLTFWDSKAAGDAFWASDTGKKAVEAVSEFLNSDPSLTEYAVELHEVNARELPVPRKARESIGKRSSKKSVQRKSGRKKQANKAEKKRAGRR